MKFSETRSDQIGITVIVVLALLGVFLLTLIFNWGQEDPYQPSITVTGEGRAFAVPDTANFSYTVRSEGKTATEVSANMAMMATEIEQALIAAGVKETDIKTENYNIYPRYEYVNRPVNGIVYPEGQRILAGYEATQTNQVRVRTIDEAPNLLSIPTENGADSVSQLQFTIWDETEIEAEARQLAIDDAKNKAQILAKQLGVSLGEITDYYENQEGGYYPIAYDMQSEMMEQDSAAKISEAQISTGENEIKKVVNITFQLR